MELKSGVKLSSTMAMWVLLTTAAEELDAETTAIWAMLTVAKEVVEGYGVEFVITSGCEGKHKKNSLHYQGHAIDVRTRDLPYHQRSPCAEEIHRRLDDDYDVLLESDHIHIEWDPKD